MEIEHLREFIAVINAGSFTAASEETYVAQPVLSKHVRAVEKAVGSQLIVRSPKGLQLTPLGEKAFRAFERIVNENDDLMSQVTPEGDHASGTLRVGILSTGVNKYIVPAISRFSELYPIIDLKISTEKPWSIVQGILANKLDVGFLAQANFDDKGLLSYHLIGLDALEIALPAEHPAASKECISFEDVMEDPLICLKAQETTDTLNELIRSVGFHPKSMVRVDEIEMAVAMILSRGGYFVVPEFMADTFGAYGNVKVMGLRNPVYLQIFFAHKTTNSNPLIPLFLNCIPHVA